MPEKSERKILFVRKQGWYKDDYSWAAGSEREAGKLAQFMHSAGVTHEIEILTVEAWDALPDRDPEYWGKE